MCDVPFFPILPICFQCGTDQNPCRCKVVGPTLGISLSCPRKPIRWCLGSVSLTGLILFRGGLGFICTVVAAVCVSSLFFIASLGSTCIWKERESVEGENRHWDSN
ncbi:uncharacterized protein BO95DRAFT_438495 [Aspergillus brunneoviolaceus CBS 621.78]|uniref:Uncharacterized protein n=1 Tax=Aspergillus brunneoviolaceus CBS 621.78 TaxID=1450534 RepID=A0ACD1GMY6_9EURO|nr:hypothetical protein BO95DRAFT_438495 [Aspergillus brunneoviolaceus CBS 621.78]RAH50729.1 hypothetical protein BO95DRAFT_438495 [Aspergillus brunneoviolaceus CBS 621.78]